jgi:enoyl-CoA hydratase/carnithine racemase
VSEPKPSFVVLAEDHDKVRVLTLQRPEKLNAFTAEGYRVLTDHLDQAASDDEVAVCVLTGSGRAFSSGVDMSEMGRPGGPAELGALFDPLLRCLARFPKPLLAAVNGLAVGFGATILLHCDIVIVDERAEIRMPFVALGTAAEAAATWLLPRRVGPQHAAWMILSGSPLTSADAVVAGLAHAAAAPGHALEDALGVAAAIAAHRVPALVANKRLLRDGWATHIDDAWQREKTVMASLAHELGPMGWSAESG